MNKLREAVRHILTTDRSDRKISTSIGLSHTTISKFRKQLNKQDFNWLDFNNLNDCEVEGILRSKNRRIQTKRLPDWNYINIEMKRPNMTLQLLWEEYCISEPDTAYGYSSFTHKYSKFIKKLDLSMRQQHRAGENVFVDFAGTTVSYYDIKTEKELKAQIFVGVLGCSSYTYVCAVRSQSVPDWIEAHNKMFQYIGGVPEVVVPDNLKSAVIKSGSEPQLNRTYLELAKHYGIVIVPARVRKPQDKSKAELGVQIASRWILARLRNIKFFSIDEINKAILELLELLNTRPFKKLPDNRRIQFEQLDKPLLKPLPQDIFEYAEWTAFQKVRPDYHPYIKDHYYSVPHGLVGLRIEARVTSKIVEVFHSGRRVASHPRSYVEGGMTTLTAHQPKAHRLYAENTPEQMIMWATDIGQASLAAVENQFVKYPHALLALKSCSSLKNLCKKYGSEQFELACQRAESIGSLTVKSIKSILQRGLISHEDENIPTQIHLPFHHNVRGSEYYFREGK